MKTERFEMRLDEDTLESLDVWRSRQEDVPSRAEAVRRLIEVGLTETSTNKVALSDSGKLLALMIGDIYKHLKVKGDIDPDFIAAAIHGGQSWGLKWKYQGIFHGYEASEKVVRETSAILDMWFFIESAYARMSKKDKAHIENEAQPFGKNVVFRGFDGNNESEHLGVAHFLIDELDRFTTFRGRDLNSHAPSLDGYRRMMVAFEPTRQTLMGGELNSSQLITLLKARVHPDYRKAQL